MFALVAGLGLCYMICKNQNLHLAEESHLQQKKLAEIEARNAELQAGLSSMKSLKLLERRLIAMHSDARAVGRSAGELGPPRPEHPRAPGPHRHDAARHAQFRFLRGRRRAPRRSRSVTNVMQHRTRAIWILVMLACGFTVISFNLIQIQLVQHPMYWRMAVENHTHKEIIPAPRGSFFDADGNILAQTQRVYDVRLDGLLMTAESSGN